MNPKSLLLILAGMTLSFGMILAIMLAAVSSDTQRPTRRRATQSRIQQDSPETRTQQRQASARKTRPTRRTRSTDGAKVETAKPAPPPSLASETIAPTSPIQQAPTSTPSQAPIAPNKVAMQQLGTLKQELNRELKALRQDRDAMLKALAQSIIALPPKEIAQEIAALDDQSAIFLLRQFSKDARGKVLKHIPAKRAQKFKKRLK